MVEIILSMYRAMRMVDVGGPTLGLVWEKIKKVKVGVREALVKNNACETNSVRTMDIVDGVPPA